MAAPRQLERTHDVEVKPVTPARARAGVTVTKRR